MKDFIHVHPRITRVAFERLKAERERRYLEEAARPTVGRIIIELIMKCLPPAESEQPKPKPARIAQHARKSSAA